jgi:NAD-dependent DNA ligase
LSEDDKAKVIAHIMDTSNWAASRDLKSQTNSASSSTPLSSKQPDYPNTSTTTPQATAATATAISVPIKKELSTSSSLALTPLSKGQQIFVPPRPGLNGAKAHALAGKTFVLTGIFPEVGGGIGLNLGKDRLKDIITAFGGKVTGSVSGKTDVVVIGKGIFMCRYYAQYPT